MSWRPNSPPSPACGLSAAIATRGAAIPSRAPLHASDRCTRRSRSGVSSDGTSLQRDMGRDVAHAHVAVRQQHHRPRRWVSVASSSVWPAIVVAGQVQRRLVQRRGDDGVDPSVERQLAPHAPRPRRRTGHPRRWRCPEPGHPAARLPRRSDLAGRGPGVWPRSPGAGGADDDQLRCRVPRRAS